MTPARILLTGAGGFVGRHLWATLAETFPTARLIGSRFDITDLGAVTDAVRQARPDVVVHLAAIATVGSARLDPGHAWRVNLNGTLNVAQAVLGEAPGCKLLFASTADAYGESFRDGPALDETARLAPLNTYGATKAAADLALGAMASDGLHAIRMRPFNHTGPGQADSFAVPAFARQIARIAAGLQEPVLNVGALHSWRDFLDVRDVCAAYAACIAHADALPPGQIVNIASGQRRRVGDVLQALLDLAGVRAEIRTDAGRLRARDIPTAIGDAAFARRVLGWSPKIEWEQTLRDVLADWQGRIAVHPAA